MMDARRSLLALLQRLSAREVAARCQVDASTVSRWAAGEVAPSERARRMLAQHCGIAPETPWDSRRVRSSAR